VRFSDLSHRSRTALAYGRLKDVIDRRRVIPTTREVLTGQRELTLRERRYVVITPYIGRSYLLLFGRSGRSRANWRSTVIAELSVVTVIHPTSRTDHELSEPHTRSGNAFHTQALGKSQTFSGFRQYPV